MLGRALGYCWLIALICLPGLSVAAPWDSLSNQSLLVISNGSLGGLDPGKAVTPAQQRILACMFDTLVYPGSSPGQVVPGLARSYSCSADGKVWRFELRRDVYFHDCQKLTATTVVNSFNRCLLADTFPGGAGAQDYPEFYALLGGVNGPLKSVRAVSDDLVEFRLSRRLVSFLEIMALPSMAIVGPSMVGPQANILEPVGTGAFRFGEWRPGQRVILDANQSWYKGRPDVARLVFLFNSQAASRERELVRGNVDVALGLALTEVDRLKRDYAGLVQVFPGAGLTYWSLRMNCSKQPFTDIRCRLALQYAFPRTELAKRFAGSRGIPAVGSLPPRSWANNAAVEGYKYDPAKARRLVGRLPGGGRAVELLVSRDSAVSDAIPELGDYCVERLEAAGLPVKLSLVGASEYYRRVYTGNYDLALDIEEMGNLDPDVVMYRRWASSSTSLSLNASRFSSSRLQQCLDIARLTSQLSNRREQYAKAGELLHQGAVEVPLVWSVQVNAAVSGVRGLKTNRYGIIDYSEVVPR